MVDKVNGNIFVFAKYNVKDIKKEGMNLKLMMLAVFAMVCSMVSAQSDFFPYGKNTVALGYANLSAENSNDPLQGARLTYTRMFELTERAPFFLEAGALFQYAKVDGTDSFKGKGVRTEFSLGYLSVPVNVGYNFNIGETGFSIAPKVGLAAIYNVLANFDVMMADKSFNLNWFDDVDAKRFNFGWQAGCDIAFKQLVLSVIYGRDFNNFIDNSKVSIGNAELDFVESKWKRFNVSIGYRF